MEKKMFVGVMTQLALGLRKYAPDFTDILTLQTWYAELSDIPDDKLIEACQFARRNLDEFPSIAWLIRKSKGTSRSDEEIGKEISIRIEAAIGKFGSHRILGQPEFQNVREYLGEIGWHVINQCGGWVNVCNIKHVDDLPVVRKRWREMAEVISKNYHYHGDNLPPQLPERTFSAVKLIESLVG